jgi:hypothetical protein
MWLPQTKALATLHLKEELWHAGVSMQKAIVASVAAARPLLKRRAAWDRGDAGAVLPGAASWQKAHVAAQQRLRCQDIPEWVVDVFEHSVRDIWTVYLFCKHGAF